MAWTFVCNQDGSTLRGDTRDDLVDEVMRHVRNTHDLEISRADAEAMVERGGRQEAA